MKWTWSGIAVTAVLMLTSVENSVAQVTYAVNQTAMIFRPPPVGCSPSQPTNCTLIEALIAAAESPGLDYIQLPPEELTLVENADVTSPLSLADNPLVIVGQPDSTINGMNVSGICFSTNTTLILINVNVRNCRGYAFLVSGGPLGVLNSSFEGNGGAFSTRDANTIVMGSSITANRGRLEEPPIRIDAEPWNPYFLRVENSVFDGNSSDTFGVLQIKNISRVTLNGTRFFGNTSFKSGGAIYLENIGTGNLSIRNAFFNGNTARGVGSELGRGGALFINNYVTHIQQSTFNNNEAFSHGGAVFYDSTRAKSMTIEDSQFSSNRSGANGGALEVQGLQLKVTNSYFVSNRSAESGGGIGFPGAPNSSPNSAWLEISRSGFSSNLAQQGGGVFASQTPTQIKQSYFVQNSARKGGGLAAGSRNHPVKIENSTFSKNAFSTANDQIEPHGSDLFINPYAAGTCSFCTVVSEKVPTSFNIEAANEGSFKFINSYLWSTCKNISSEFSLTRSAECTSPNVPLPLLSVLDLNDLAAIGNTLGHSPAPRSIAINRIRPMDCGIAVDQAGNSRPSGGRCEMGAIEVTTNVVRPHQTAVHTRWPSIVDRRRTANSKRCPIKVSKSLIAKIKIALDSKSEAGWSKICQ